MQPFPASTPGPQGQARRRLTLSFDNGPHFDVTPSVLDILDERKIKTSFFAVGKQLEDVDNRQLVQVAHGKGHWIGNHTYSHRPALGERTGTGIAESEIGRTQELLGAYVHPAKLFRPSGGGGNLDRRLLNAECFSYLRQHQFSCVLWNCVPGDLAGLDWVARALAHIEAQPWTLLVLHDVPGGALPRLNEFLDAVHKADVQIVQEFPAALVPMQRGEVIEPMDAFIAAPEAI